MLHHVVLHHVLHHVLVTDCLKANQGAKWHKDVEATIIHHLNTYTNMTATKAKPLARKHDMLKKW